MAPDRARAHLAGPRRSVALGSAEARRLPGGVTYGRIVRAQQALPAVRPVDHVVGDSPVVVRTHDHARRSGLPHPAGRNAGRGRRLRGGAIDPASHLGWSVVVTGRARLVTDPGELARQRALSGPWADADRGPRGPHPPRTRHRHRLTPLDV